MAAREDLIGADRRPPDQARLPRVCRLPVLPMRAVRKRRCIAPIPRWTGTSKRGDGSTVGFGRDGKREAAPAFYRTRQTLGQVIWQTAARHRRNATGDRRPRYTEACRMGEWAFVYLGLHFPEKRLC
jgi:hypothetical protein